MYIRYTAGDNRATNTPVDIVHTGGATTVPVNQKLNGGTWYPLVNPQTGNNQYSFNAGTSGYVRIRNTGADGYVIADAVKFTPVAGGDCIVIDNVPLSGYATANLSGTGTTVPPIMLEVDED